ncbi:PKD domain-containing protein [Echinicola salinicaeni]|uniref:PKD domain-containing protein n=1 Tax=Echinicola salinicaeni TaxID=2762757 RepID=UPI0016490931|nr:PKD domain-containing protein [Echinicola salinicaeni]
MKSISLVFLFTLTFCIACIKTASAQLTTVGEAFWVGFMENFTEESYGNSVLIITANEPAKGTIDLSNFRPNWTINFDLQEGESYTMRISTYQEDLMHRSSGTIENKGVFVSSDGKISVYAFNERYRSADGTVVLPLSTLGKDYLVTSHFEVSPGSDNPLVELNAKNESLLLVVGVEDDTRVEITPSVDTDDGKSAKVPFELLLNEGQSIQLRARGDLTGSRVRVLGEDIEDCKNIAVFGGNKWTGVGQCGEANDHLFQQVYPISTWGTQFIHIPFKGRTSGEMVKVLAAADGTEVSLNGQYYTTLNEGEYATLDFENNEVVEIETSQPADVSVFAKSQMCNDQSQDLSTYGDPFMISYSPNQQLLKDVTFEALDIISIEQNYVNIITYSNSVNQTFLDGQNIGNQFNQVPGNAEFSYARVEISSGSHHLQNNNGFIGYVYGFGYLESYGYSVGANLENLNFEVDAEYRFEVFGEKVACLDQEALWSIVPENPIFTYFQWDFGDGSEIKEGNEVNHTFQEPGTYTISIIAAVSQSSCDQQEEIVFEVEVLKTSGEIVGPEASCPFEEMTYELIDKIGIERYDWKIQGGEIISQQDNTVKVIWGGGNEEAELQVQPFTFEGCPGEPIVLKVNISNDISPDMPKGAEEVCFDPDIRYEYMANNVITGRQVDWYVSGGEIISVKNDTLVEIRWNQPGVTGELWFEESNGGQCSGISEILSVSVREEIKLDVTVQNGLCFGDQSAFIELDVIEGASPFSYSWGHDPSLNSSRVEGLPEGTYSVMITDANGCQKNVNGIEVGYPDPLEAKVIALNGTSCYGRADGFAELAIQGGTKPYAIDYEGFGLSLDKLSLPSLSGGIHAFTIVDRNGCSIPISFEITSPAPLEVGIEVLRRSCPGEADGELFAIPRGGREPFSYTWDYENQTSANLNNAPKGTYTVTVTDENNCISFGSAALDEMAPAVRMPNAFKPSDNSDFPYFEPVANCPLIYKIIIYNRWGELIYMGNSGWDGTIAGEKALPDTYNYVLEYTYQLEGNQVSKNSRGTFQIVD